MNVPIIGQPIVGEWFFTVLVTCPAPCSRTHIIHGKPGSGTGCPSCGNAYQLASFPVMTPEGLQVQMTLGQLPKVKL